MKAKTFAYYDLRFSINTGSLLHYIEDLKLHECSYIIEFIKRVGENDKMRGFAEHLIGFLQRV